PSLHDALPIFEHIAFALQFGHAYAARCDVHAQFVTLVEHDGVHLVVFAHALLLGRLGRGDVRHQLVDLLVGGAVTLDQLGLAGLAPVAQRADHRQVGALADGSQVPAPRAAHHFAEHAAAAL